MNIARSSFRLFAAKFGASSLTFLGTVLFARELDAATMGTFFLFQALLGILATPADFGLRFAIEKRLSEGESPGSLLASGLLLKAVPLALVIGFVLLFRNALDGYFGARLTLLLVVALVLQEFADFLIRVVRGELRVGASASLQFVRDVGWVLVGVPLVLTGIGVRALVYGLLTGFAVGGLWGLLRRETALGRPSWRHARSLFRYAKFDVVSGVGRHFYSRLDLLVIAFFLPQSYVGSYEMAWLITMVVILASDAIATTVFPQVSEWSAEGSVSRIEELIPTALTPALLLVIPSFFGTLLLSREILSITFGPEYTVASAALVVLMGEKILQAIHLVLGRSLRAIDKPELAARVTAFAIGLNIALNFILIPRFGLLGAAVATTLSFGFNTFAHVYYLSRFISLRFPLDDLARIVGASLGMAGVLIVTRSVITVASFPTLGVTVIMAVATYSTILSLFRPMRRKLLAGVNQVMAKSN